MEDVIFQGYITIWNVYNWIMYLPIDLFNNSKFMDIGIHFRRISPVYPSPVKTTYCSGKQHYMMLSCNKFGSWHGIHFLYWLFWENYDIMKSTKQKNTSKHNISQYFNLSLQKLCSVYIRACQFNLMRNVNKYVQSLLCIVVWCA